MISADKRSGREKIGAIHETCKIEFMRVIFVFSFKLYEFISFIICALLLFVTNKITKIKLKILFDLLV